jgi:HlyD family secretion protein
MQTATMTARTGRRKRRRWIIFGIIALILAGLLLIIPGVVRNWTAERSATQSQPGDIVSVFLGDLAATASATGRVEPLRTGRLAVDSPGLVEAVHVRVGEEVQTGDLLVQLDTTDLALRVEKARQNLALRETSLEALLGSARPADRAAAEASVHSAQVRLDELLAGPGEQEILDSETSIRTQQATVASATASYNIALNVIKSSAVAAAETELLNAEISYEAAREANEAFANSATHESMLDAEQKLAIAQAALDELRAGPDQGNVSSAAAALSAARANLEQAEANHQRLLAGPTASQIAAAQAALAQAESQLAALNEGASAEDVAIAEAGVQQARLALLDAQESLAKASITAPLDGVVTAVHVVEGEYASGNVVELASDALQVILSVDEIDIGLLAVGQPAVITLEAWPDVEIDGEIAVIAPSAQNSNGIVAYDVQLSLAENDLPILIGMTANASLLTSRTTDVLLVPNAAITADRGTGIFTVNLVTGRVDGLPATETVEVTVGLKDRDFTQITAGLSAGDEVVIGELDAPTFRFGQGNGPFSNGD